HHPLLSFFFLSYRDSPCPHSFPTRRSSDLETTSKGVKLSTTYPLLFSVGNGSGVNVLTDLKIEYVGTETKSPAPKTLTIRVSPSFKCENLFSNDDPLLSFNKSNACSPLKNDIYISPYLSFYQRLWITPTTLN